MHDEARIALLSIPLEACEVRSLELVIGLETISTWYTETKTLLAEAYFFLELLMDRVQRILDGDTLEVACGDFES
jgi:hypothetical protein